MGNATHYIPMFKLVTPDESVQIVDNYSHKQRTVQERDMGRVYQQIYTEKCTQMWRFAAIDLHKGEDPDDEKWYDSDEEGEAEGADGEEEGEKSEAIENSSRPESSVTQQTESGSKYNP